MVLRANQVDGPNNKVMSAADQGGQEGDGTDETSAVLEEGKKSDGNMEGDAKYHGPHKYPSW